MSGKKKPATCKVTGLFHFASEACNLSLGSNVDAAAFAIEEHAAINQGENRVIAAHAHALAGVELGATLTDDDVAGDHSLTTKLLHAETLAAGIATVTDGTLTFLMCHD